MSAVAPAINIPMDLVGSDAVRDLVPAQYAGGGGAAAASTAAPIAPTEVSPSAPREPTAVDRLAGRMGALSDGFTGVHKAQESEAVSVLGRSADEAAPASLRSVEPRAEAPPSYRELMQSYQSSTSYAIEINLVGTAGSTMTGAMSKLMSGN